MKVFREDTRSVSFLPGNRGTSVETTKKSVLLKEFHMVFLYVHAYITYIVDR